MTTGSAKTLIAIDPDQFDQKLEEVNKKLDRLLSDKQKPDNNFKVEWITSKIFMEAVSIKAFSSFYKVLDSIPESMKRKIGGKVYVHKDTIQHYFEGKFS